MSLRRLARVMFVGVRGPRREMVMLVTRRDLRESTSDARLLFAMTSLTFVIPFVAAAAVAVAAHYLGPSGRAITERLAEVGAFFVVFLPASFSLVLALESFSGERERNTLETLFATPLRESEIYLGKCLAVIIPSLTLSYAALLVYALSIAGLLHFVAVQELAPLVVVTLAQAMVMVAAATIVSSQTKTLRSANVMASFIIIPMSGVIQFESVLIISSLEWVLWAVAAILAVIALFLLRLGIIGFNRENILAKESRPPDRRAWVSRLLSRLPRRPGQWANLGVALVRATPSAFRRSRGAIAVSAALLVLGGVAGLVAQQYDLVPVRPVASLIATPATIGHEAVLGTPPLFLLILRNNLLVGALMVALAPVTLGVFGGLGTLLNGFVVGYVGGVFFSFSKLGFFVCGIAPHGIIELPALVLAAAFALRVGATMVRPSPEGWLAGMRLSLADYSRGALVFVPMFAIAAGIEAFITPLVMKSC
ncbi:MAG TPA: stage II sporulation protein M [Candidatus Dormibacteraeota bacterium]|nr:stage II sporulation protein M [Candidatus Dormibacteraeota bacterium]